MKKLSLALTMVAIVAAFTGSSVVHSSTGSALGIFEGHQDVGPGPRRGTASFSAASNTYRVTGGGANVTRDADSFQFVYLRVTGEIEFSADVRFEGKVAEQRCKAALMIRQSLEPDSAYAEVALHGDGSTSLEYRPSAGVNTSEFRAAMKAPSHLGIVRHGHEFTISAGNVWGPPAMTGPVVVTMRDPVYLGFAVSSQNTAVLDTAFFTNVRIVRKQVK